MNKNMVDFLYGNKEDECKVYEGMKFKIWRKYFEFDSNGEMEHTPLDVEVVSTKHSKYVLLKVFTNVSYKRCVYYETLSKYDFPVNFKENDMLLI